MIYKLDQKDRKIIYELDKNARISHAQIARKVGLSTEVVHYRIKNLEKRGIIIKYHTAVNYTKLGLIHFKICLQFNGISLQKEEQIYNRLKKIPQVIWIAKCNGDFDSMISCTVKDMKEFDQIKDKVLATVSTNIAKKSIAILSDWWSFPRNFLVKKEEKTLFKMGGEVPNLDETDLQLLRILADNARKPIIEIAKEINSTAKIITGRIKKLQKKGVINYFRTVLDYEKLGMHFYKTYFSLKDPNEQRLKQLIEKLNQNPNVVHNIKVIAEWDLEPEFEFEKDLMQETIQSLMNEFSDIIKRISVVNILKEYKYTLFYK